MKIYITLLILLLTSYVNAEIVKVNFCINKPIASEEFQEVVNQYNVQYVEINQRNNKYFYLGVMDETVIDDFTTSLSDKKPKILGSFRKNGLQHGRRTYLSIPATYDSEGNQLTPDIYNEIGGVKYPFNKKEYLDLMKDKKTYDIDGVELSSTRPTKVKETHNIAGWETSQFPE